jgi:hypothetical protein
MTIAHWGHWGREGREELMNRPKVEEEVSHPFPSFFFPFNPLFLVPR